MHESSELSAPEEMVRLRLDIAYDGTNFAGWAMQPGFRTVQHEIEQALGVLLRVRDRRVPVTVGGRTDAGVHARGQVAHVDVTPAQLAKWTGRIEGDFMLAELRARRINGILKRESPDVVVHRVSEVPNSFHARFSATKRRYEYRIRAAGVRRDPLSRASTVDLAHPLDLAAMQSASASLLGLRDFTTFCKAREGSTAVRTLLEFSWRESEDGVLVGRIVADAFCHSMVRALVGGVVAVGDHQVTEAELEQLLEARARTNKFNVMQAHGLSLEEITYPPVEELAARAELTRARREAIPPRAPAELRELARAGADVDGCAPELE